MSTQAQLIGGMLQQLYRADQGVGLDKLMKSFFRELAVSSWSKEDLHSALSVSCCTLEELRVAGRHALRRPGQSTSSMRELACLMIYAYLTTTPSQYYKHKFSESLRVFVRDANKKNLGKLRTSVGGMLLPVLGERWRAIDMIISALKNTDLQALVASRPESMKYLQVQKGLMDVQSHITEANAWIYTEEPADDQYLTQSALTLLRFLGCLTKPEDFEGGIERAVGIAEVLLADKWVNSLGSYSDKRNMLLIADSYILPENHAETERRLWMQKSPLI